MLKHLIFLLMVSFFINSSAVNAKEELMGNVKYGHYLNCYVKAVQGMNYKRDEGLQSSCPYNKMVLDIKDSNTDINYVPKKAAIVIPDPNKNTFYFLTKCNAYVFNKPKDLCPGKNENGGCLAKLMLMNTGCDNGHIGLNPKVAIETYEKTPACITFADPSDKNGYIPTNSIRSDIDIFYDFLPKETSRVLLEKSSYIDYIMGMKNTADLQYKDLKDVLENSGFQEGCSPLEIADITKRAKELDQKIKETRNNIVNRWPKDQLQQRPKFVN